MVAFSEDVVCLKEMSTAAHALRVEDLRTCAPSARAAVAIGGVVRMAGEDVVRPNLKVSSTAALALRAEDLRTCAPSAKAAVAMGGVVRMAGEDVVRPQESFFVWFSICPCEGSWILSIHPNTKSRLESSACCTSSGCDALGKK
jgi:hypothetical protein